MCPSCNKQSKTPMLDGMLCNDCWDLSFHEPLPKWVKWGWNKKNGYRKGDTMLSNYDGSLDDVNTIKANGALTTITKDGTPGVGVASKTGDKWMNGLKFIFDGKDNKQASMTCVAYGEELVDKISEFLEANQTPGKDRPFGRLMVEAKVQSNNYEQNGKMVYKNELVIQNVWNAPKRGEDTFEYEGN